VDAGHFFYLNKFRDIMNNMLTKILKFVFPIILLASPFFVPDFKFYDEGGVILTSISLLFAILVGFFIATSTSNYLRLQALIADANAGLVSLYNLTKKIEPSKKLVMEQAIDEYMIASLDYELLDFTSKTRKEFGEILKIADSVEPKDPAGFELFAELHSKMSDLFANNQASTLTAKRVITFEHWVIIILLAILIGISLLGFRDGTVILSAFIGIIYFTIFQILVLIHDLDTNLFLSKQLSYEDPQEVFYGIGRANYYPEYAIKKGYVKPKEEEYRIGVYKNYPESFEKEIKLVGTK